MARYEISNEIRPLDRLITGFASSCGYEIQTVFNDLLRFIIHGFSPGAPPISNWKYKRQQNASFMEMTAEWTRIMQKQIGRSGWFDAFGELHMAYCSKPGQQANGQFFTPSHICELMVMCAAGKKETGQRMGDPTCGSGRLLLAYHAHNPGNYLDDLHYNDAVAQKLIMFTFCDGAMVITPGNADTLESMLNDMVAEEKEAPTVYPDLSDLSVVFFGDSVIGNYTGSFSIPGVVNGFSGAHVYNCAQGGATASKDPATDDPAAAMSFVIAVDTFLKQDPTVLREDTVYRTSLEAYLNDDHRGRRLCFVINYGLNDYFSGYAVDDPEDPYDTVTYCGALRTGIRSLQEAYPDALILLAAPNYITFFENGTELHGEAGSTLTAYVQGAADVADQMGVPFYDTYHRLGVTADNAADYLADAVHLNEEGRFLFGTALIATLDHSR